MSNRKSHDDRQLLHNYTQRLPPTFITLNTRCVLGLSINETGFLPSLCPTPIYTKYYTACEVIKEEVCSF